jgi:hypothetical protein
VYKSDSITAIAKLLPLPLLQLPLPISIYPGNLKANMAANMGMLVLIPWLWVLMGAEVCAFRCASSQWVAPAVWGASCRSSRQGLMMAVVARDEARYHLVCEGVSLGYACRFIHSPEILECIPMSSVDLKGCFVQIRRVHAPHVMGKLVCVNMEATVRGVNVDLRLFSDRAQRVHLLCLYRGEPLLLCRLGVRGLLRGGGGKGGHALQLRVRYFRCPRFLSRITSPVRAFWGLFDKRAALEGEKRLATRMMARRRNPHLIAYRAMLGVHEP